MVLEYTFATVFSDEYIFATVFSDELAAGSRQQQIFEDLFLYVHDRKKIRVAAAATIIIIIINLPLVEGIHKRQSLYKVSAYKKITKQTNIRSNYKTTYKATNCTIKTQN